MFHLTIIHQQRDGPHKSTLERGSEASLSLYTAVHTHTHFFSHYRSPSGRDLWTNDVAPSSATQSARASKSIGEQLTHPKKTVFL